MTVTPSPTAADVLAEGYLDARLALDPIEATNIGVAGFDGELPALDPDWYAQCSQLRQRTLRELDGLVAVDANDRVTLTSLRAELSLAEQLRDADAEESALNNIDSPLQQIREVFDLTPTATVDNWADVARRLAAVPQAVAGYEASLRAAAGRGTVSPRRQVAAGIAQCADNVGPDGFFATFAASASTKDGAELPATLRGQLARAAELAAGAYAQLASFLGDELLPRAGDRDAVGRERYALHSQAFLGARIDPDETYRWGQDELARITTEMAQTAHRIRPGASVRDAMELLDSDPARQLSGTDALQRWMQQTSDDAVAALAGTHFDIPEPIRTLECRIAPTQSGGIYYTGPSEDLVTRPGRMWWSVPKGETRFATWRERSTVYHEGVPGHHLQVAQTSYRRDLLNRWRRLALWLSGHGEGWALYAERLMGELGFLDDPADYLGMLDGQSLRAARVVIDIGVHCELPAPAEVGGGPWTYAKARDFLAAHAGLSDGTIGFELDRYFGWPGQASSYKIGERFWLQLREDTRAAEGAAFDLRAFHRRALDLGSVGLDVLRSALLDT